MPGLKLAILLGHSHTGAFAHAVAARPQTSHPDRDGFHLAMFAAWKLAGNPDYLVEDPSGADRFNAAILENAAPHETDLVPTSYITMFGGNDWSVLSMMRHGRPYDFVLPDDPDLWLDPDAEHVPADYIEAVLKSLTDRYARQLLALRRQVKEPIYAIVPPPPIEDNGFVTEKLDEFFRTRNDFSSGVTSPTLRLKMWRLQRRMQRDLCVAHEINLIDVPDASVTVHGFLRPEFYGNDATHANPAYGEHVLQQIEAAIDATLEGWNWYS